MSEFLNQYFHIKIEDGIVHVTMLSEFIDHHAVDFGIKKRLELTGDNFYPMVSDL